MKFSTNTDRIWGYEPSDLGSAIDRLVTSVGEREGAVETVTQRHEELVRVIGVIVNQFPLGMQMAIAAALNLKTHTEDSRGS